MIQADTLKPGWKLVKFGDVVRLSKERAANPVLEGIERYVGLEHIDPDDLRIRRWGFVAEGITFTSKFKPGQVLFGKRRAYQRKLAVADFEGVCSGDIYVFESADSKVLLPELLPFICQTGRFFEYAIGTSAGSLSPRTNWTSLANFEFALPSLEEQEKIKYALIIFEENINLYFQAICQIESIIQSLMFRWLSVITNGANKPYLEFKELPYNYKIYSIGEFTQCLVPGRTKPKEFAGDIPWVTTSDINSTTIDSAKVECCVKKDELARVGGKTVPQGSVIMTCVGELGITALAPTELSFNQQIHAFLPSKTVLPEYFVFALRAQKRQMLSRASTTTVPYLNKENCESILIPVVPIAEQQKISSIFFDLENQMYQLKKRKEQSVSIKQNFINSIFL